MSSTNYQPEDTMRDRKHYLSLLAQNPGATVGFTLAASAVYAARFGECEDEHRGTEEWATIARDLKSRYGENLDGDQVRAEMKQPREK
jgi:hypothetical protein